jgi:hypothetical protein
MCLRAICTSQLPRDVQTILAAQSDVELDTAARCADRITEAVARHALASIGQPADNAELVKRIDYLSRRVEALSTERNLAPVPGTVPPALAAATPTTDRPPGTELLQPHAGTMRKIACRPAPTVSKKTNTADVSGGQRLHYNHRPPLRN